MSDTRNAIAGRSWSLAERRIDGHRHISLLNLAYRDYPRKSEFPWFLLVSIPLQHPRRDGLCSPAENAELDGVQNSIMQIVAANSQFHFIGRITHRGVRELVFHIDEPFRAVEALDEAEKSGPRPYTFGATRDDEWQAVSPFLDPPQVRRGFRWPWQS